MMKSIFEVHWSLSLFALADNLTSVDTACPPLGPSPKLFISNLSPILTSLSSSGDRNSFPLTHCLSHTHRCPRPPDDDDERYDDEDLVTMRQVCVTPLK